MSLWPICSFRMICYKTSQGELRGWVLWETLSETLKKDWRSLTCCFLFGVGADVNTVCVHNAVNGQGQHRLVSSDRQVKTSLSIFVKNDAWKLFAEQFFPLTKLLCGLLLANTRNNSLSKRILKHDTIYIYSSSTIGKGDQFSSIAFLFPSRE